MTVCPRVASACTGAALARSSSVEHWPWHGYRGVKVARQTRRSCLRRPLVYNNLTRQGFDAQLEPDCDGIERAMLTGGNTLSSLEQRHA
jgi:hypothetical protein